MTHAIQTRPSPHPDPSAQIASFRAAVQRYEDGLRDRLGGATYASCRTGRSRNDALADALDGLDLTPSEWHLMEWFLSWDAQAELASILVKAREQGRGPL